jgi:UDP-galactopyranose mutase
VKSALIIGGGFAGCATAHQLALLGGWDVTIVESAPVLGAGVRTQWYGGHPHTFGPRHFLTENERVYQYLHAISPLRLHPQHEFLTYVEADRAFYNFPINVADVARMPDRAEIEDQIREARALNGAAASDFEEYWLASVGRRLYDKMVRGYTAKMWQMDCRDIDTFSWSPKGVALKEGPRAAWDEAISGYPEAPDGYNRYFDVATACARVLLNARAKLVDVGRKEFVISVGAHAERRGFDLVVSTISPDLLFDACYGALPYLGRDIQKVVLPVEFAFPENVYFVYYAGDESFTRITEYKKFTGHKADSTLIGIETPSHNGRHYPLPLKAEMRRAARYHAAMPAMVYSIGRAGSYRYGIDIDDCIEQAMLIAGELRSGAGGHPVTLSKWREI